MNGRKQLWVFFIVVAISLAMPTGVSAIGMPQDAQEVANATGPNWSPRGPLPRNGHSAVLDTAKNKMIVFGGSTFSSDAPPSAHFNDVWYLNSANSLTANERWTVAKTAGTPPNARLGHSAVLDPINNRMIIFGGAEGFAAPCDNDVWVLENANGVGGTPTWTPLSPSGTPMYGTGLVDTTGASAVPRATLSIGPVLVGSTRFAPFPWGPRPSMKADICTLHKPDILFLRRQARHGA